MTASTGANIDQVALLRDTNGALQVVWHQEPQGSSVGTALMHTVISATGKVGPPQTTVSGWAGIGDATMMRAASGQILLFLPATRSASTLNPFQSIEEWTSSDDGATWTVAPAPIAFNGGFADPVGGALGPDGATPFVVSDAGAAVSHAAVTVAGHHLHTDAHGTASVTLGPFRRRTTLHVGAGNSGYAPGAVTVRVSVRVSVRGPPGGLV